MVFFICAKYMHRSDDGLEVGQN